MGNYPLTAKEQHKRKEKLAKIRQTVIIVLMVVAGLYYMTVERSQVTNAAVVTNVEESAAETNRNQNEVVRESKFEIDSYLQPETIDDAPEQTVLPDKEAPLENPVVSAEDKRVNLNTATLEELDALPGVGPSTAKNIIAYREAHGGFAAPEEIMNVKRIGEKTFDKLKDFIKV